jgi:cytidylate kinase
LVQELILGFQGISLTRESYQLVASRVIREVHARESCVFLGRAAQVVLANKADAFHVHIVAPMDDRVVRLKARDHIDTATALDHIRASDQARQRYIWSAGQVQWDNPLNYDLVVNTHRIAAVAAADTIERAARESGALAVARRK